LSRLTFSAFAAALVLTIAAGAATQGTHPMPRGKFVDDYNGAHEVTDSTWHQGRSAVYRIVKWDSAGRYVIAQNGPTNPTAPGLWTRIDWITLDGMPPYTWAFCFSAYDAPTADSAEATRVARASTPRTGCNGFPYSRLKPAT
jgi:hypothetical protein